MHTFVKRPKLLSCLLALSLAMTATLVQAEASIDGEKEDHSAHQTLDWPGIYFGFTPCADCPGVKTTLALNKNNSYILITMFAGKSDREFVEKGKFEWTDKPNTIVLIPKKGGSQQKYLVSDNALIQLDQDGNRFTGKNAERYVLRRTDVTDQAKPASHNH